MCYRNASGLEALAEVGVDGDGAEDGNASGARGREEFRDVRRIVAALHGVHPAVDVGFGDGFEFGLRQEAAVVVPEGANGVHHLCCLIMT